MLNRQRRGKLEYSVKPVVKYGYHACACKIGSSNWRSIEERQRTAGAIEVKRHWQRTCRASWNCRRNPYGKVADWLYAAESESNVNSSVSDGDVAARKIWHSVHVGCDITATIHGYLLSVKS